MNSLGTLLLFLGTVRLFNSIFYSPQQFTAPLIPISIAITDLASRSALSSLCSNNGYNLLGDHHKSYDYGHLKPTPHRTITFIIVLLLSGDIQTNPGPLGANIYPCGFCELRVDWSRDAVCCDNCSMWFHCSCIDIGKSEYSRLTHSSVNWACYRCCMQNDSITPYSYNVEVSNSFSALQDDVFVLGDSSARHSSPIPNTRLSSNAHPSMGSSLSSIHTPLRYPDIPGSLSSPVRSHSHTTPNTVPNATSSGGRHSAGQHIPTDEPSSAGPQLATDEQSNTGANSSSAGSNNSHIGRKDPENLRTLVINCQSVRNKQAELCNIVYRSDPDIVILTETWLDDTIESSEFIPQGYKAPNEFRKDRDCHGGGVMVLTRDTMIADEVKSVEVSAEVKWLCIRLKNQNPLYVGSFYRSPINNNLDKLDELSKSLDQIADACKNNNQATIFLGGDFNVRGIDWEKGIVAGSDQVGLGNRLLEVLSSHGLSQMQREPTREGRILDLFCSNKPGLVRSCHAIPGLSDHDAILTDCLIKAHFVKKPPRKISLWSKADWEGIKLKAQNFTESYLSDHLNHTVEENYVRFREFIESLIDEHIPSKITSTRRNQPWFNSTLRKMVRKKSRLFSKAKQTNRSRNWEKYKSFKKDTHKALRKARWDYIENMLQDSLDRGDTKSFWRYIASQRQDSVGVSALKVGGRLVSDGLSKAEALSKQFQSVFTKDTDTNVTKLYGPNYPGIGTLNISHDGVTKLLSSLNTSKAAGPDAVPCRLLKELSSELSPLLCALFRQSLDTGQLPNDWLKAYVTPVFKKGPRCAPENYRPVSLTCVPCKILEHIICKHIRNHLDEYGILSKFQHGFRYKHSCETQLLATLQDLLSARDKKHQTDLAILDFAKAFDTVPHSRLLGKLEFYGVQGSVLNWTASFLKAREQSVVVEGRRSGAVPVESGVPQGTVLGPLLFLLHINDLPSVVSSRVRLFADDCLLYRTIATVEDHVALQQDLHALERWGDTWGMRFNASKCEIMHIRRGNTHSSYMYQLGGQVLKSVNQVKYLGVWVASELSWSPHVEYVTKRANRSLGFLRRNLRRCPASLKERAYLAQVRSVLEYCASIWDPFLQRDIHKLERIQRRAARFVCGDYRYTSSVTAMLDRLGWRDLETRRRELRLTILFKVINGHVAVTASELDLHKGDPRTRTNHEKKYRVTSGDTREFDNFITIRTIPEWNSLRPAVVEASTTDLFRARLARTGSNPMP